MKHITVLKTEAVNLLELTPHSTVVDATYGAGGHASEIWRRLGHTGTYVGIDADAVATLNGTRSAPQYGPRCHFITGNFSDLTNILSSLHIDNVDAILADLGWRTDQMTTGNRGFSFLADEPLIMTYGDPHAYLFTADDIINHWAEADIANVIFGYGEERAARRIAKAIVTERKLRPIKTAQELAKLIEMVCPRGRKPRIHPATKTFQALRIAVNDELGVLERFITAATQHLSRHGTLAIITFHSLEDRIVKQSFRELAGSQKFTILTRRPIIPTKDEMINNPRARSAKLRAIRKN